MPALLENPSTKQAPRVQVAEVHGGRMLCTAPWPGAKPMPLLDCSAPETAREVAHDLRVSAMTLDAPALCTTAAQRAELLQSALIHLRDNTWMECTGQEMLDLLHDLAVLMGEATE